MKQNYIFHVDFCQHYLCDSNEQVNKNYSLNACDEILFETVN